MRQTATNGWRRRVRGSAAAVALVTLLSACSPAAPSPGPAMTDDGPAVAVAHRTSATPADRRVWRPRSSRPLTLHWVLGDRLDLRDPRQMGLRSLTGRRLRPPDVYDIDLEFNSTATVRALHARGKKVICYIDVGAYETYRRDAAAFEALSPRIWGRADVGWEGSYWLDIRRIDELEPIMRARIQACKDKGFDAVEPDEMTGWSNDSGFPLTYADQLAYNRAVARWAHEIGISVGMKGDIEQAHDLARDFDWFLVEECFQYTECARVTTSGPDGEERERPGVQSFTRLGKAVWVAEYRPTSARRWRSICRQAHRLHVNVARYRLGLPNRGGRQVCPARPHRW